MNISCTTCNNGEMTEQGMIDWIDRHTYKSLLSKWRNCPVGCPFFVADTPVFEHYEAVMNSQEKGLGAMASVISKEVGWNG